MIFFFLGLPSVGLGKEKNVLVGRARRKTLSFFLSHFLNFSTKIAVITELSKIIQTIWNYQKLSGTIKNVRIASENYPELSKTIRSYQKLSGTIKKCTDSFRKLSGTIKNYPELSKAIRNYQKCTDSLRKLSGTIKNYLELYLAIRMRKTY